MITGALNNQADRYHPTFWNNGISNPLTGRQARACDTRPDHPQFHKSPHPQRRRVPLAHTSITTRFKPDSHTTSFVQIIVEESDFTAPSVVAELVEVMG